MSFKFSEIEGIDADLAAQLDANDTITQALDQYQATAIEQGVKNRLDVIKPEFKSKMDALDAKYKDVLSQLGDFKGMDIETVKIWKSAAEKNSEITAQLDAMKQRTEEAEAVAKSHVAELQNMRRLGEVTRAINEYDSKFETRKVKSDAKDIVAMLSEQALRYDDEAKRFKVYNGDEPLATDQGPASTVDWLVMLRKERPSLFEQPSGSGAPGSTSSGSASNTMTRGEFERLPPAKQGEVVRTHTITD